MKLIEQRRRNVYNAKSIKQSISQKLMKSEERLNGPCEMVKLLHLFINCGEKRVIQVAQTLGGKELSLAQIKGLLIERPTKLTNATIKDEISTNKPNLST